MKVYLAGPQVFLADPKAEGERLKSLCAAYGLEGVFPMDAGLDLTNVSPHKAAGMIYQANIALIQNCDAVLADMQGFRGPSMDVGTAFEMGYGKALGKYVIGYLHDQRDYLDKVKDIPHLGAHLINTEWVDHAGWRIEEFNLPDNLMMVAAADKITPTFQEALKHLASIKL